MWLEMTLSDFDTMLDDFDIYLQFKNNPCVRLSLLVGFNLLSLYVIFGHIFAHSATYQ